MSAYIINAAPMTLSQGTQDLSTVQLPRVPVDVPQHCPKFYLYTQKGTIIPQLVSGVELANMYGAISFDERSKYCNHATIFANRVNVKGNAIMVQRVIPKDAGPRANVVIYLDVLPTQVNEYARNSDGSIKIDPMTGNPVITGKIDGFKLKWVKTTNTTVGQQTNFGKLTVQPGDQVDQDTAVQSQRYPIFEFETSSEGEWGNNVGFRMWAPTAASTLNMPKEMMAQERAYPFYFSVITRESANATPKVKETTFGDQSVMFTLKPNTVDPVTDNELYMGDAVLSSYQNLEDSKYPAVYGDFGRLAIYNDNIEEILKAVYASEVPFIDIFSDISSQRPEDYFLMNIISGVSSQNVPYHSVQFVDEDNSVILSEYSNIFAQSGSDGTMNDKLFAELVEEQVVQYADPNSPLQEEARNVESIMYDSGFPVSTKKALTNFISVRKDTFVVLSTHVVGGPTMNAAEEYSLAISLRTRLQMFPESDYFGTPVMRGMIVGRSGKLLNSKFKERLPLTLEIAIKSAEYMGASNGRWKNGHNFDAAPGSVVDNMYDISITWVPNTVRNKNWDAGLNWVQAYDLKSYFMPALKTVYDNDTSVLNSYFVAMAICQLNKISSAAWREFSGTSGKTDAQLVDDVNNFVKKRVNGIFDNRYVVVPDAYMTDMDTKRGFSWTLPIKLYAPNMKSVMTTYVQSYRIADLATNQ